MPVEVAMNTPLADALQHEVQGKLVENGWAPGDSSDTTMAEYLILMVVNGKREDEIAVELASDLLNLGPEDNSAREFSRWLFATIEAQNARLNGPPQQELQQAGAHPHGGASGGDDDMDMDLSAADNIIAPTGPKALRNGAGNNFRGGRDKRMLGQGNRQMDRTNSDAVLHRIRGQGGQTDRINSHTRGGANGRGGAAGGFGNGMGNGMGMGNGRQPRHMMNGGTQARFNHALANMGGAGAMANTWMGPVGGPQAGQAPMQPGPMDVYAMLEQQSRMMQQMQQQMQQQQQLMQNSQNRRGGMNNNRGGRPLSDRGGRNNGNSYHNNHNNKPRNGGHDDIVLGDLGDLDEIMQKHSNGGGSSSNGGANGDASATGVGGDSDMDMALGDPRLNGNGGSGGSSIAETVCKFNLHCANKDCKFAHQSPAAPPGTTVNVHEVCSFGAACKNKKCTSRHPSPAARAAHQSEMDCKYFPNCTNPHCPFRHPSMPLCRNGGDCTVRGCKFTHVQTMCKFRPCTNRFCTFKHEEGQRGVFPDKVWTADGSGGGSGGNGNGSEGTHISERKFVDESAPEETILPDADNSSSNNNKDAAAEEPVIA